MNVLVVGCGLTGARLANQLDERGYDVSVVEEDSARLSALKKDFSGLVVCGDVMDIDVLRNAGCENVTKAIVVTKKDNVNVMVAQILKSEFEVEEVYVRVLDPSRESLFRKFGLNTVCPTRFESDVIFDLVTDESSEINSISVDGNSVQFLAVKAEKRSYGLHPSDLVNKRCQMPIAVKKATGHILLANDSDAVIEEGDKIVYAMLWDE